MGYLKHNYHHPPTANSSRQRVTNSSPISNYFQEGPPYVLRTSIVLRDRLDIFETNAHVFTFLSCWSIHYKLLAFSRSADSFNSRAWLHLLSVHAVSITPIQTISLENSRKCFVSSTPRWNNSLQKRFEYCGWLGSCTQAGFSNIHHPYSNEHTRVECARSSYPTHQYLY